MRAAQINYQSIIHEYPYIIIAPEEELLPFFVGKLSMAFKAVE